jgi:SAM-dependent methyltransferase
MRTNRDWEAWGKVDPLYGVASIPGRAKTESGAWTASEFLELGERDWNLFRPQWEQYGVSRESCLEIGCGAGRITSHLARDFELVHAVDVSADMVRLARLHVDSDRVTFHVTDGVHLPIGDGTVASAFSTHVFQHFASTSDAAACFRELHRVMRTGGTLMIHLPIIVWPHGRLARIHELVDGVETWIRRGVIWTGRFAYGRGLRKTPVMDMTSYDVDWLSQGLVELGFRDIEIRVVFADSEMGRKHPFLFARKAAT